MDNKEKQYITQQLEEHARKAKTIKSFLDLHEDRFVYEKPGVFIRKLIAEKDLNHSKLLKKLSMSKSYFYEILGDKKLPSRNHFLQLVIAVGISFEDCQIALKTCGYRPLYSRNRWDAIIIYCIENNLSLVDTNIILESQNMAALI